MSQVLKALLDSLGRASSNPICDQFLGHKLMQTPPIIFIPGLGTDSRLYEKQIPALWQVGPVIIANQTRKDSMTGIAQEILSYAPPRFALAGLSMGGYVAFQVMRQAPERVLRLALLDTTARADTPEQTARRKTQIEMVRAGRFAEIPGMLFPLLVHADRREDESLPRSPYPPANSHHGQSGHARRSILHPLSGADCRGGRRSAYAARTRKRDGGRDRRSKARHCTGLRPSLDT